MSPHPPRAAALVLGVLAIASAACERDRANPACLDMTAPGIVIMQPPIDVTIRNATGRGIAAGATVVVRRTSTDSIVTGGLDTVHIATGYPYAGTYAVRVSKPFYADTLLPGVIVRRDECGRSQTTQLPLTLRLLPGAPAVRSVAVIGSNFVYQKGEQVTLRAWLDANAGVSDSVTWRSSNTALATVSGSGVLTAGCVTTGGSVSITATSIADTTVHGSALIAIGAQTSCP